MKFLFIFDYDAVWTLIPLVSLLWALGGSGPKFLRSFGVPLAVSASAVSFNAEWWVGVLVFAYLLASIKLVSYGSNSRKYFGKLYWTWLYIAGGLYALGLWPLLISFEGKVMEFIFGVISCAITFGILTYGSQNHDFPRWKFVEMALGAALGAVAAIILYP